MSTQTPVAADPSGVLRTLAQANVAAFAQDRDLRYRWIENPPSSWHGVDIAGKSEIDVLPARAATYATALKREVLQSGRAQWAELIVDGDAGSSYFDVFLEPERDETGEVVGLIGLAIDTTDRRKQEVTIDAIARDLSHRTKKSACGNSESRHTDGASGGFHRRIHRAVSRTHSVDLAVTGPFDRRETPWCQPRRAG